MWIKLSEREIYFIGESEPQRTFSTEVCCLCYFMSMNYVFLHLYFSVSVQISHLCQCNHLHNALSCQFAVLQIEYPLGSSSKKGSHIYFLLIVAMVLLLWCQIVLLWHQVTMVASEQHLYQTIVQFDKTIILPRKLATGSIHDYLFCCCPLVCILFKVLIITFLHLSAHLCVYKLFVPAQSDHLFNVITV